MKIDPNNLAPIIELARRMKPSRCGPVMHIPCACMKEKPVTQKGFHIYQTKYGPVLNNVCQGCERLWKDHPRIVCCRCKTVVLRMEPIKDPKTGFVFERGKDYHIDTCPVCNPGQERSVIIEKKAYEV